MDLILRPYQENLKRKTREAFKTYKRVIMLAPCGSGKTVTSASIMKDSVSKGRKVWFVVHRRELQSQAENTLERYGIPKNNIKVYMVQTLAHKLDKIDETPDMIIFDECQHCTSSTYLRIIEKYSNAYILGLSATPRQTFWQTTWRYFSNNSIRNYGKTINEYGISSKI